jgi:hypothetical protein
MPSAAVTTTSRVRTPEERRRGKVLNRVGVLFVVVGALLAAVPAVMANGVCAFVPCDPSTPTVGFTLMPDGAPAVETGPAPAADIQEVVVLSGPDPSWHDSPVLWRVERAGDVPVGWSGEVVLGVVPEGFTETVPLTVPLSEATGVGVDNVCYGWVAPLPTGPLVSGVVTSELGRQPIEEFRAASYPFSPCRPDSDRRPAIVGIALAVVGLVLVVVAGTRYGPVAPRRPSSGHRSGQVAGTHPAARDDADQHEHDAEHAEEHQPDDR